MATTKFTFQTNAASAVIKDTDSDITVETNVNTGGGNILQVTIDNSANTVPHTTVFWDRTDDPGYDSPNWGAGPTQRGSAPSSDVVVTLMIAAADLATTP